MLRIVIECFVIWWSFKRIRCNDTPHSAFDGSSPWSRSSWTITGSEAVAWKSKFSSICQFKANSAPSSWSVPFSIRNVAMSLFSYASFPSPSIMFINTESHLRDSFIIDTPSLGISVCLSTITLTVPSSHSTPIQYEVLSWRWNLSSLFQLFLQIYSLTCYRCRSYCNGFIWIYMVMYTRIDGVHLWGIDSRKVASFEEPPSNTRSVIISFVQHQLFPPSCWKTNQQCLAAERTKSRL